MVLIKFLSSLIFVITWCIQRWKPIFFVFALMLVQVFVRHSWIKNKKKQAKKGEKQKRQQSTMVEFITRVNWCDRERNLQLVLGPTLRMNWKQMNGVNQSKPQNIKSHQVSGLSKRDGGRTEWMGQWSRREAKKAPSIHSNSISKIPVSYHKAGSQKVFFSPPAFFGWTSPGTSNRYFYTSTSFDIDNMVQLLFCASESIPNTIIHLISTRKHFQTNFSFHFNPSIESVFSALNWMEGRGWGGVIIMDNRYIRLSICAYSHLRRDWWWHRQSTITSCIRRPYHDPSISIHTIYYCKRWCAKSKKSRWIKNLSSWKQMR